MWDAARFSGAGRRGLRIGLMDVLRVSRSRSSPSRALAAGPPAPPPAQEDHGHDQELEAPLVEETPVPDGRLDEEVLGARRGRRRVHPDRAGGRRRAHLRHRGADRLHPRRAAGRRPDGGRRPRGDRRPRVPARRRPRERRQLLHRPRHLPRPPERGLLQHQRGRDPARTASSRTRAPPSTTSGTAVWSVGSRRTADGWVTEMVIPFETLRFPRGTPDFGGQLRPAGGAHPRDQLLGPDLRRLGLQRHVADLGLRG